MRYLHTLDPDDFREMQHQQEMEEKAWEMESFHENTMNRNKATTKSLYNYVSL